MATHPYQLVFLGPIRDKYAPALRQQIEKLFADTGLDFASDAQLLVGGAAPPDWGGFPVAIWFGAEGAAIASDDAALMREFLERGFTLFTVVEDLSRYSSSVPAELKAINGQGWDLARVSADVMKGFRLARKVRQAFISYKRTESAGVAHQLFHELNERCYRVFLDTASVEAGADFQKALWSRMADVDLLILLDTPNALLSTWVHQEFNRAHDLGLGVVQLIWPGHSRTRGTELSLPIQLEAKDFVGSRFDDKGVLETVPLANVLSAIEGERIRSLSARRTRLIEGLLDHVKGKGATFFVHPMRHLDVLKDTVKVAEVLPFVGVPDSLSLYQCEKEKKHDPTIVVFNGLGVDEEWAEHLRWLNKKATVTVHQIDDFGNFLGGFL
jgi:hypothetical protein